MISDNELLTIVRGLYEKTSKERVGWQPGKAQSYLEPLAAGTPRQPKAGPRKVYELRLPESAIDIEHVCPPAEPDYIHFTLRRASDGQPVGHRQVYEGDFGWNELFDLYALVSRQVLGWDNVINDVKRFIGTTNPQPVS